MDLKVIRPAGAIGRWAPWVNLILAVLLAGQGAAPVAAQTNVVTLSADGAYTWFNDPRAVFLNDVLYFGYNRSDGRTALSAFDPARGTATLLWTSSWEERDDHDNPGLLALEDGRLLAIYARHGTSSSFNYRTSLSTNPVSPADWSAESSFTTPARATYSNPYQLSAESGLVYNFLRDLNFNPSVTTSSKGITNWSPPRILIKTGTNSTIRPYVKYASDYRQRIDFLYTDGHPRSAANSLYHMYYHGGNLHRSDGSLLKSFAEIPLLHDAGERGSVVYQYNDAPGNDPNHHLPGGRAFCWEIVYQTNGYPACVFSVRCSQVAGRNWSDDRIYYYYARWTGTQWQKRFIAHAGRPLYQGESDYAGGICLDPEDANVIYLASNAAQPFDLNSTAPVPLNKSGYCEIFRGVTTDDGLSFRWQAITTNSTMDNLRPYVPRHHGDKAALIWFRGDYSNYSAYRCSIVGLFGDR